MPNKLSAIPSSPKSLRLTVLFLLFPLIFFGQTLTGLWTGALSNDSSTARKDQSFEIALTEYKGKVYGYSRSEFIVNDTLYYILKRVKGTIDGDLCEVTDDEIVSYNFRGRLDKGIKVTSTFRRNQNDSTWQLDGNWKTNATKKYYSVTGKVNLEAEKDLAVSKLFPHLEELKLADDVAFFKNREEETPTVKVAKPEKINTSYTVKRDIGTTTIGEPIAIAAKPAANIPSVVEPTIPETKEELPAIKKSTTTLAKTEVKNIPVTTETIPTSSVATTTVPVIIEQPKSVVENKTSSMETVQTKTDVYKPVINNIVPSSIDDAVVTKKPIATKNNTPTTTTSTSIADNKTAKPPAVVKINQPVAANQSITTAAKSTKNDGEPGFAVKSISAANTNTIVKTESVKLIEPNVVATAPAIKKETTDITQNAAVIAGRKSEFSQVVNFKSDSLIISLYDNGEIDGDTVSVFMNGETILSKQGLKSSAIKKTIYLTGEQKNQFTLVMFAESLGKYPPNTGLLVIRDGDDVYNLRFSSDFQKNAGIVFRRKE
jgi:hypothetical protein